MTFELFVRPALLKMTGRKTMLRAQVDAVLEDEVRQEPGRETYVRVRAWRDSGGWRARLTGRQGSNMLSSLSRANAFAVIPAERPGVAAGERVRLLLLEPLEGW